MSLELALQECTTAINTLVAALKNAAIAPSGTNTSTVISNDKTDAKTDADTKGKTETKAKVEKKTKTDTKPELTYGDISPKLLQLAQLDRSKLVEVLTKHGVKKGTELEPHQFEQVQIDVDVLLNPVEEPEDSLV